jgi:amino acid transporter
MNRTLAGYIVVIQYWDKTTTPAAWITLLLGWTFMINMLGVRGYGESEFIYSMTKVIAILGFIILGVVSA